MVKKFKNRYRTASTRLPFYDYGSNGSYFVTICTKNKEPWFGEIQSGIMCLSSFGQIAHQYWKEITDHFDFVELDDFIIMPDHIHGIIEIQKPFQQNDKMEFAGRVETPKLGVSTWTPANLGVIINQYKRACLLYTSPSPRD